MENPVYYQPPEEISIPDEPEPPVIEEITAEETTAFLTLEDCVPVNLNEADIELLVLLPYVDEEIALEIIELRNNINGFSNVYELLYVDSLSDEQVREIIEYVCV
ncbi:MAG: helix-hairpin-helix domain-containing protein [Ruminococcus flavefaciens]|nr:helix-hairpin-helix domain-containing protein [Ruminococcus flavefaciens]MCM1229377.1 helix-hairpin-helix domain-containing protein [Ruminococcus flavefaciens]